jgi:hypothetical protein
MLQIEKARKLAGNKMAACCKKETSGKLAGKEKDGILQLQETGRKRKWVHAVGRK